MADITANVSIWDIRAGDMALTPNEQAPELLRLILCEDVRIVLRRDRETAAGQAAAMRELARLATEAAEDLEKAAGQVTEARDG
jgi:hypothetical protein